MTETLAAVAAIARWLRLGLETAAMLCIAVGALTTLVLLVRHAVRDHAPNFTADRLVLARFMALALEFQLAADVLDTALAPSWTEIGELAAIATIRTVLNLSLTREIADERAHLDETEARKSNTSPPAPA